MEIRFCPWTAEASRVWVTKRLSISWRTVRARSQWRYYLRIHKLNGSIHVHYITCPKIYLINLWIWIFRNEWFSMQQYYGEMLDLESLYLKNYWLLQVYWTNSMFIIKTFCSYMMWIFREIKDIRGHSHTNSTIPL